MVDRDEVFLRTLYNEFAGINALSVSLFFLLPSHIKYVTMVHGIVIFIYNDEGILKVEYDRRNAKTIFRA